MFTCDPGRRADAKKPLVSNRPNTGLGSVLERNDFWEMFAALAAVAGKATGTGAIVEGIHAGDPPRRQLPPPSYTLFPSRGAMACPRPHPPRACLFPTTCLPPFVSRRKRPPRARLLPPFATTAGRIYARR